MPTEADILKSIMSSKPLEDEMVEITEEPGEVEDTEDGGALVSLGQEAEAEGEFYDNLAATLADSELNSVAVRLCDLVEKDREARKRRDQQYEEGLKRTGLGNDAPGGAQFDGASRVVHPMLVEACIDFAARAMKELFPASGPAKDFIPGDPTAEKVRRQLAEWRKPD